MTDNAILNLPETFEPSSDAWTEGPNRSFRLSLVYGQLWCGVEQVPGSRNWIASFGRSDNASCEVWITSCEQEFGRVEDAKGAAIRLARRVLHEGIVQLAHTNF